MAEQPELSTFAKAIIRIIMYPNKNGITNQAELAFKSDLSRATISRIFRNSNDKGKPFRPTAEMVMSLCVAAKLNRDEAKELFLAAFPWDEWWQLLDKRLDIDDANTHLQKMNLPALSLEKGT